ncbi:hypothetical protein [Streptosporangium canum]
MISIDSRVPEGIVNKIKAIKRQMFGRANLNLFRVRVIHAI